MENHVQTEIPKPHILAISMPYQGHISPMIQFAKRLVSKGLKVTIITPTCAANFTTVSTTTNSIDVEYISYEPEEGKIPTSVEEYLQNLQHKVSAKLPEIIERQKKLGRSFDVLVHDSLMPYGVDLGHEHGLKVAPFFTQACVVSAIYYHVFQRKIKCPVEEGSEISFLDSSITIMEAKDLPYDLCIENYPGSRALLASQFSLVHKADWTFFNTFVELENEVVEWLSSKWKIMTIGPSIPSMFLDKRLEDDRDYGLSLFKPDREACIKWLDTKASDSVVYVSFGSLSNLQQDKMDELAWGLLNSKYNFLWVVRDSEKSKLPKSFIEEAGEKGLIVDWCPQLEVLSHKAVGSFMTHCGWNSTLEALSLGVPMLVMPQWTDQMTNAKYIVDVWKTGVRVKPHDQESITRDEIVKCIIDVMEGTKREELKANSVKWKEMAVEAMSEGGSSDKNIDEFISRIMSPTSLC